MSPACPDRYSAPPVETWTIPSDPASASPRRAAFKVWEDDTFTPGNANPPDAAASSIAAYCVVVAMGIDGRLAARRRRPHALGPHGRAGPPLIARGNRRRPAGSRP